MQAAGCSCCSTSLNMLSLFGGTWKVLQPCCSRCLVCSLAAAELHHQQDLSSCMAGLQISYCLFQSVVCIAAGAARRCTETDQHLRKATSHPQLWKAVSRSDVRTPAAELVLSGQTCPMKTALFCLQQPKVSLRCQQAYTFDKPAILRSGTGAKV